MALINREQALSHPFANGQYDKEHADEHFIMGFEDYKAWLEDLPTVEAIPKADYEARLKADMMAILTEIQLEIEDNFNDRPNHYNHPQRVEAYHFVFDLIQNKINAMRKRKDLSININSEK